MTPSQGHTQTILKVMLLTVALATFTISAGSLTALAEAKAMSFPWLVPVMVDLAIMSVSVAAFSAACRGCPNRGLLWLTWGFTALSVTLNVCHVVTADPDYVACGLHALPPIVTTAVFEVMLNDMHQARSVALVEAPAVTPESPAPTEEIVTPRMSAVRRAARSVPSQRRTKAEMAREEGIGVRQWYRRQKMASGSASQ
jgi:hypothetical protein